MKTNTTSKTEMTPGFNCRIGIFFDHDRHGRKLAYYWTLRAGRAIRMNLDTAELLIAQEQADLLDGHPLKPTPSAVTLTPEEADAFARVARDRR